MENSKRETKRYMKEEEIHFSDLFEIEKIQYIQDLFAETHGVASVITNTNGVPITKPSNFTRFCKDVIRKTDKGCANCYKSDALLGQHHPLGPIVQPCLSGGLWDAGASITVNGKHIASWLIGQVRNDELDEQSMLKYADEIGADKDEFIQALNEVPVMSVDQFQKVSKLLFAFANELSEKAYTNAQLNLKIAEQKIVEQELIQAKEKAEESDRIKTAFLQNMSHEIRTPMNSIMGFASLLTDEEDKNTIDTYSDIIFKNAELLVHVIDHIILYSQLQNKQFTLNPNEFDVSNLINDVKLSFNLPEYQKEVELISEITIGKGIIINSDYDKIRQIFTNLIANAFKYTQKGTISFGITIKENEQLFFVKDTGIGIPKLEVDKIFERFYRASNVNKSSISGTGLGLSIVKELIDILGGRIWVESIEGKGCIFFFAVPY